MQTVRATTAPWSRIVKACAGSATPFYLVGNGPQGTGLYRCRDTKGNYDRIDEVGTLLHHFNGGMGEHGPHAILHGPDGRLYVVNGNHSWAKVDKLASNSPLTRWPNGQMTPDQYRARLGRGRAAAAPQRRQRPRRRPPGARRDRVAARPRRQERGPRLGRLPQRLRRRPAPRRRVVHLRQRHGMGRKPAVVPAGVRLPLLSRRRLQSAAPARPTRRPTISTACRPFTTSAAARRSAWSSTNTPPSRPSTRAPT